MAGYGPLAADYDLLTTDVDYEKMAAFLRQAKRFCKADTCDIFLDAGCGSGRLLAVLAQDFESLIGVDASSDMLEAAIANCPQNPPLLLCQPLESLDLFGTVQMAASTLDTLNHIIDAEDLKEVLRRISLFLEPGGLFVFDVNTLYKHRHILADNTFVDETEDCFCVWEADWDPENRTTTIQMNLFDRLEDNLYNRQAEMICQKCWLPQELALWLQEAHFELLGVYDDYTQNAPGDTTQRLTYLCRKLPTKSGGQVD